MSSMDDLPAIVSGLPEPHVLQRRVREAVETGLAAARARRGAVTMPEDTYDMQRRLARSRELFAGYAAAFTAVGKILKEAQEDELVVAVGEQEGIPQQGMTVPDAEGDIRLSLEKDTVWAVDMDQVLAVFAQSLTPILDGALETGLPTEDVTSMLVNVTYQNMLSWGKFTPQVTKIRAFKDALARTGSDNQAAIVGSALSSRQEYKGVKFERKTDPR